MARGDHLKSGIWVASDVERGAIPKVPFAEALLEDRDWGLGGALRPVATVGDRRMFLLAKMGVLWAKVRGGEVVHVEILEGHQALDAWVSHGWSLPAALTGKARATLHPGTVAAEALNAVWPRMRRLQLIADRPGTERERVWLATTSLPYRWGLLEVRTAADDRIHRVKLLEDRPGFDRYQEVMRREGRWPPAG